MQKESIRNINPLEQIDEEPSHWPVTGYPDEDNLWYTSSPFYFGRVYLGTLNDRKKA